MSNKLNEILDRVDLVIFRTRIVTTTRDTGESERTGSRVRKTLQECFDKSELRPFNNKKSEAIRLCRTYGTKIESLDAWAVPTERTEELSEYLRVIENDWRKMADDLSRRMPELVDSWARKKENREFEHEIRALAPTEHEVRANTRFIFTSFKIRPDDVNDNGCLEMDLSGLAGQALHEFAVAMRDASMDRNKGGTYTSNVRDVLSRIAIKAESLSFIGPIIGEVATTLKEALDFLPKSGQITGIHAVLVKTIAEQMLSPRRLLAEGFAKMEVAAPVALPPSTIQVEATPVARPPKAVKIEVVEEPLVEVIEAGKAGDPPPGISPQPLVHYASMFDVALTL